MNFKKLRLYSANLAEQKQFYTKQLGFELLEASATSFSLKVGKTILEFVQKKGATPYHYAINIPSNKGKEALDWLQKNVEILDYENALLVDFLAWNAEAVYFYDKDQNIVEFIARKNLKKDQEALFELDQVMEISEIGLPTTDVLGIYNQLKKTLSIEVYSGDLVRFAALGDERALFIVVDHQQRKWIPRNDEAYPSPFELWLEEKGQQFKFSCKNGVLSKQIE